MKPKTLLSECEVLSGDVIAYQLLSLSLRDIVNEAVC
jgi:hypothetical protein